MEYVNNIYPCIHIRIMTLYTTRTMSCIYIYVTSTVFESKDEPTQMTKQSFTIIYFITYKKTTHFKLICKNVHSCRQYFSKHMDTV